MRYTSQIPFALVGLAVLVGCSAETTSTYQTTPTEEQDISSWDFGEVSTIDHGTNPHVDDSGEDQYAIAVATFTGGDHNEMAIQTLARLMMQYPSLSGSLKYRERSRGSVLTYGQYTGYDDPKAKLDIEMLRSISTPQGVTLFRQVLLTKFKSSMARHNLHPYDLWTVRREFPTMVPIYTLEVAVWGDFESGQYPKNRRHSSAEKYASELRRRGFEAFFYHNDEIELSSVTVGLYSYRAIDSDTGFFSPEVEAMRSRFPERLVNGEPLLEYLDPANQTLGTRVQPPCLAEVPID